MLRTETDTPHIEKAILRAARARFGLRKVREAFYEHGQWWVTLMDGSQWSVCDAEPGPFYFEMVSESDD